MFCPECGCEYRPGFTVCADCRVSLVAELPRAVPLRPASGTDAEPVLLCSLGSSLDAGLVRSLLEGADIPCAVGGDLLAQRYEPITIQVRRQDLPRARELLASLRLPTEVSPSGPPPGRGSEPTP